MPFLMMFFSSFLSATELVYTPTNPTFGGNPLNGAFLLNKAQSQNDFSESSTELSFEDQFKAALDRNIISNLASRIASGDLTEGSYNTGEYQIDVTGTGATGVVVTITNIATGEITVITMPSLGGN
ncbi:curli production assembly protein CsgF [Shewanella avicenniae]|uniref:Curli production assembly/transport component CsgF n=2 Tax=Shewanella avicenniae TaxID=2814294 RepID=A0ABX7QVL2_9GAMM|nr:curli production assembly protein CsgF [Shewanella avicenniae]